MICRFEIDGITRNDSYICSYRTLLQFFILSCLAFFPTFLILYLTITFNLEEFYKENPNCGGISSVDECINYNENDRHCYACVSSAAASAATCHDIIGYCHLKRSSCTDGLKLQISNATFSYMESTVTELGDWAGEWWYLRSMGAAAIGAAVGLTAYSLHTSDNLNDRAFALRHAANMQIRGTLGGILLLGTFSWCVLDDSGYSHARADDVCERLIPSPWFPLAHSDNRQSQIAFVTIVWLWGCMLGVPFLLGLWKFVFLSRLPGWMIFMVSSVIVATMLLLLDWIIFIFVVPIELLLLFLILVWLLFLSPLFCAAAGQALLPQPDLTAKVLRAAKYGVVGCTVSTVVLNYAPVVIGFTSRSATPIVSKWVEGAHVGVIFADAIYRVVWAESDVLTRRTNNTEEHVVSLLSAFRAQFLAEHTPPSPWNFLMVVTYLALKLTPCVMFSFWPRASLCVGQVSMLVSAWLQFDNFTRDRSAARGNALYAKAEQHAAERILCPRWYVFMPAVFVGVTGVIAYVAISADEPSDGASLAVLGTVCCPVFAMFVTAVNSFSPQDNDCLNCLTCTSGTVESL